MNSSNSFRLCTRVSRARPAKTLLLAGIVAYTLSACGQTSDQPSTAGALPPVIDDPLTAIDESSSPAIGLLAGDALIAPPQPELQVNASRGYLNLSWEPLANQQRSRVFHYDTFTGNETLIEQFNDNSTNSLAIPSHTHLRAWHREQYRVELCADDDCVSSQRMGITGLAASTVQTLTPAVFIDAERFGDDVVMNKEASLLVAALPVAGALQLYLKPEDQWVAAQLVKLDGMATDESRQLKLALSATGDTIAIAVSTGDQVLNVTTVNTDIRIVERLGEGWIETARWRQELPAVSNDAHSLTMAADGDELLISAGEQLYAYQRSNSGWSESHRFDSRGYTIPSAMDIGAASRESRIIAHDIDDSRNRVFTLDADEANLWVSVWQRSTNPADSIKWQRLHSRNLIELDAASPAILKSNNNGSVIAIASWEPGAGLSNTPVLWRYAVPEDRSVIQESVTVMDSLRLAPVSQSDARLRFDADDSLNTVVIGWQGSVDSTTASDAALFSYRFNETDRQWISQLELPEAMPTLAKQAFAGLVRLAGNGENLIMVSGAGQSLSSDNRVGEILSLR